MHCRTSRRRKGSAVTEETKYPAANSPPERAEAFVEYRLPVGGKLPDAGEECGAEAARGCAADEIIDRGGRGAAVEPVFLPGEPAVLARLLLEETKITQIRIDGVDFDTKNPGEKTFVDLEDLVVNPGNTDVLLEGREGAREIQENTELGSELEGRVTSALAFKHRLNVRRKAVDHFEVQEVVQSCLKLDF